MEVKFLALFGLIGVLITVLVFSSVYENPVIRINKDELIEEPALQINLSEEKSGQISGVLEGPTIVNITSLNSSK